MEESEKDKAVVIIARAKLRIATAVFFSAFFVICSEFFFKGVFQFRELPAKVLVSTIENEMPVYEPMVFNEADVKDGIHVPSGMPADTGCAEVIQNCGACHSLDLVKQNRATKEGWKEIIVWMQETQKLWDLGTKENVILDFLAKNYGPENSGRRKNLENVEWYEL
ncbi:monoheme cytochrome C [Crocinitomix catalasitica]|nr:monoheme cytochrome C [Crocinitomix catalasitica]